ENRFPGFHRHAPEEPDQIVGLVQKVHGPPTDPREKISKALTARVHGSWRVRFALYALVEAAIDLGQNNTGYPHATRLENTPGAQNQPRARTVKTIDFASIDGNLVDACEIEFAQRLVHSRRFRQQPVAFKHEAAVAAAPVDPQGRWGSDRKANRDI